MKEDSLEGRRAICLGLRQKSFFFRLAFRAQSLCIFAQVLPQVTHKSIIKRNSVECEQKIEERHEVVLFTPEIRVVSTV